jgi:hypothetical protein
MSGGRPKRNAGFAGTYIGWYDREPWSELANGWPLPYNQDFAKL